MLAKANRLHVKGDNVFYKQYFQDFAFERLSAPRADTQLGGFSQDRAATVRCSDAHVTDGALFAYDNGSR
jgi:hypothetical protein